MALHAVQSAIKTLIVGGVDLPPTVVGREKLYRDLFPGLSSEEVQDLALIPPHRLTIYTDSIFSTQGGILQRNFPCSVAMVKEYWSAAACGGFSVYRLAQQVHRCAAWRGLHSDSLGESFITFLASPFCEASLRDAGIVDLATFELSSLRIRKAPSEELLVHSQESFKRQIEEIKIDDLLGLSLTVPRLVHVLPLSFDVVEFQRNLGRKTEPLVCIKRPHTLVGARPIDYGSAWYEVPTGVGKLLGEVARDHGGRGIKVASLAEAYLPSLDGDSDTVLFHKFMTHVGQLIEIGALVLS